MPPVHDSRATPVRPRLGARAWAVVIPAGVIVVGLLVGILLTLNVVRVQLTEQNQRTRLLIQKADPTLQRAPATLDVARPVLRDAAPVLAAARKAIPQARRDARAGRELLAATKPVVDDLAPSAAALPAVLADLGPAAADLRPVVAALGGADLPGVLGDVQRLASAGERALPPLAGLATEVKQRELLRRASRTLPIVGRIAQLQRAAVQINRQTLTKTGAIERMFAESLELQRRLLTRVESIDRKLPGPTAP